MSRLAPDLKFATPAEWATIVIADFDTFLPDHANMERKASAMALSFVAKYPDREAIIDPMLETALEELEHFRDVYRLMQARGLPLKKEEPDAYANGLVAACRHGRDERFMDRMIVASIIECRGAERFRLITEALEPGDLRNFYRDLWACEAKHGNIFIKLLTNYFPEAEIYHRYDQMLDIEAQLVANLPWTASLH